MRVLAADPSLTAYGWAVIDTSSPTPKLVACGCIQTAPEKLKSGMKKKDLQSKTDYDTVRAEAIASGLKKAITDHNVTEVVFENPAGSKNANAAAALKMVKGITIGVCAGAGVPSRGIRARQVKGLLSDTSDTNAAKSEIMAKVREAFEEFDVLTNKWPKVRLEAASDAVGVYLGDQLR